MKATTIELPKQRIALTETTNGGIEVGVSNMGDKQLSGEQIVIRIPADKRNAVADFLRHEN